MEPHRTPGKVTEPPGTFRNITIECHGKSWNMVEHHRTRWKVMEPGGKWWNIPEDLYGKW